jgi:hypothetical protein
MRWLRRLTIAAIALYGLVVAAVVALEPELVFVRERTPLPDVLTDAPGFARVSIDTADGVTLAGLFREPDGNKPVFLFLDGQAMRLQDQNERWQRVAAAGFGALTIAYRGYAGSTGVPTEAGLHLDAAAAHTWLSRRVPPDRIVVHGFSLGSSVATRLARDLPVRALILEAPPLAAVDVAAERFFFIPVAALIKNSFLTRDWIDDVRVPLLIVHGDRDEIVPFNHGERLFQLANEPKTFIRIVGGTHMVLARLGLYTHIEAFLDGLHVVPRPADAAR